MVAKPNTATDPQNAGAFSKASGIIVSTANASRMPAERA